jgi:hypothetical protein
MKKYLFQKFSVFFVAMPFLLSACTKTADSTVPVTPGEPVPGTPPVTSLNVTVSTIAGKAGEPGNAEDGDGINARFWNPTKMVYNKRNNTLYVADGTTIRSIDQQNSVKTYMPPGTIGNFNEIQDIDLAPGTGGTLYFISKENDIWKIAPNGNAVVATRIIDRVYGGNETGALNASDQIDGGTGIATGRNNEIYFLNSFWNTLRKVSLSSLSPVAGVVESFAGKPTTTRSGNAWPFKDGQGEEASFGGSVSDMVSDGLGNLYIADFRNDLVRMVTPSGMVSSLFQFKDGYGIDKDGAVSIAQANRVTQVSPSEDGGSVFFTTYGAGGNNPPALRVVKPGKEVITLVGAGKNYGDGAGTIAGLDTIGGIAATPDGKTIYIAEPGKKVIRKVVIQ